MIRLLVWTVKFIAFSAAATAVVAWFWWSTRESWRRYRRNVGARPSPGDSGDRTT